MSTGFKRVVVAGQCTIDDIHLADGRFLPRTPGGAAAYAVLGAAMYGGQVTLVSLLGDDYPFERFRAGLVEYGSVDLHGVRRAGPRSIHNVAWYRSDGARHFDIESWDVVEALTPTPTDLPSDVIADAGVLLTPCSLQKQFDVARFLRKQGCPVAIDTEIHYFPTEDTKEILRRIIAQATYFLPSIEHLQLLYGSTSRDVETYDEELIESGCPWTVVKRGAQGSTLIDRRRGQYWRVPAVPAVSVVDPTGAGDGFDGGFMAALADGKDPLDAACWGAVTASFVVESVGAVMPVHFAPDLALERFTIVRSAVLEARHA
jgi:2-dehydro-3-deoxygluconokinase